MIPYGRPPTAKEFSKVFQFLSNRSDLLDKMLGPIATDITANDMVLSQSCFFESLGVCKSLNS